MILTNHRRNMTARGDPEAVFETVQTEMQRVLIGNEPVIERLFGALMTGGHVLLEGPPGVAKTTIAELFARVTGLEYNRIQLTPDTLPADITGTTVYREETDDFEVRKGPVFANVVIADEINRATPKTQSALLEAMQERQVTIDGTDYRLPEPFLVVATQNPLEMEGTFELPEAQRDRFQFKRIVEAPNRAAERQLLERFHDAPTLDARAVEQAVAPERLTTLRETIAAVHIGTEVREYLLDLITATREHPSVAHGASPRAALQLQDAVKARAAIHGRTYVIPDDIKQVADDVLAHRLVLSTDATLGDVTPRSVVEGILADTESPSAAAAEPSADSESLPE